MTQICEHSGIHNNTAVIFLFAPDQNFVLLTLESKLELCQDLVGFWTAALGKTVLCVIFNEIKNLF